MARTTRAKGEADAIHVALLRGINVGGKHKLPMQDLARMFVAAGCRDVRTYIQSGNVLFAADPALAGRIPASISRAISAEFGIEVPVVIRSAGDLRRVASGNPFLKRGADESELHVAFLRETPAAQGVASLDPARSPGDEFAVAGREIYLRLKNGVAKTKLTNAWFDSRLGTVCTARNWNTVMKLVALAGE